MSAMVRFPDGTTMRACPLAEKGRPTPTPDFGLYADVGWHDAAWTHELIDWPDFGLPSDPVIASHQIRSAWNRAWRGELVEVGCIGATGRTGTILACMAVLAGVEPGDAVAWIRANYKAGAVETSAQEDWVRWFADEVVER